MTPPAWLRSAVLAALAIGLLLAAAYGGWMVQGWRKDVLISNLEKNVATANQAAANARADRADKVLEAERAARDGIQAITDKLTKEKDAANHEKNAFITGVRSGAIRLSVPVVGPVPTRGDCTSSGAAGGAGDEARAELTPAAAEFFDDIADEGDAGIRQANALIDAYNVLREKFNVQAGQPARLPAEGR
jgi:hypothetical protein